MTKATRLNKLATLYVQAADFKPVQVNGSNYAVYRLPDGTYSVDLIGKLARVSFNDKGITHVEGPAILVEKIKREMYQFPADTFVKPKVEPQYYS